jgi:hypothetical protein
MARNLEKIHERMKHTGQDGSILGKRLDFRVIAWQRLDKMK